MNELLVDDLFSTCSNNISAEPSAIFQTEIDESNEGLNSAMSRFETDMENLMFSIVSELYSHVDVPRKLIKHITKYIGQVLGKYSDIFNLILKLTANNSLSDLLSSFEKLRDNIALIFKNLSSDYLTVKTLEKKNNLSRPKIIQVGERYETRNGILKSIPLTITQLPIVEYFRNFFQMENVLTLSKKFIENLQNDEGLRNIIQTELWKNKTKNGKTIFPLCLYYDEIEVGNALGSHGGIHKLGAVYASLPIFPGKYRSKLENIFPVLFFHSSDIKSVNIGVEA